MTSAVLKGTPTRPAQPRRHTKLGRSLSPLPTQEAKEYILIVDDCPPIQNILDRMLAGAGYRVDTAADGLEALEKVWLIQPDLILLDIGLPDLNGYDVYATLRGNPATRHIPVILMSVYDETPSRRVAYAPDGPDFLTKPVLYEQLLHRVERRLNVQTQTR